MNLFVPVLMAVAALLLDPRRDAEGHERASIDPLVLLRIFFLLLVEALLFSVLGGALLTRYLLPMYPLVLLLAVTPCTAACLTGTGWRCSPPRLHRRALRRSALRLRAGRQSGLRPRDPHASGRRSRELKKARSRRDGTHGLAHERRADKARARLREAAVGGLRHRQLYRRRNCARRRRAGEIFGGVGLFHQVRSAAALPKSERRGARASDTSACTTICRRKRSRGSLGGTLVWKRDDDGMWIALIRFNRQIEARLEKTALSF